MSPKGRAIWWRSAGKTRDLLSLDPQMRFVTAPTVGGFFRGPIACADRLPEQGLSRRFGRGISTVWVGHGGGGGADPTASRKTPAPARDGSYRRRLGPTRPRRFKLLNPLFCSKFRGSARGCGDSGGDGATGNLRCESPSTPPPSAGSEAARSNDAKRTDSACSGSVSLSG